MTLLLAFVFHLDGLSFSIPSLSVCMNLQVRWVSYRQCIVGCIIHSASPYLLNGGTEPIYIQGYWQVKTCSCHIVLWMFYRLFCTSFLTVFLCLGGFPHWYSLTLFPLCLDSTSEFYCFTCFHNGGYFFISRYKTPLRISCKASLAVTNSLHFCLSVKDFTPFSFLKCSSAGYSVLGSQVPPPPL